MKLAVLPINSIVVKDRFREDLGDLEALAATIKEKGLIQPITIDKNRRLLAGGRRLEACKLAGRDNVPCIIRDDVNDLDAVEVELVENAFRKDLAWPERAKLEARIFELKAKQDPQWSMRKQSAILNTALGQVHRRLKLAEALELLPDLADYEVEDQAWKVYQDLQEDLAVTLLARHPEAKPAPDVSNIGVQAEADYIINDAFVGMAALPPDSFHFAEVDPPYGVDLQKRKSRNTADGKDTEEYQEIDASDYPAFFSRVAINVYRILRPNTFAVFWYGIDWHSEVRQTLLEAGFSVPTIPAIWTKGAAGQTASPDTTLASCYEPFWLARKGTPVLNRPGRSNVFAFQPLAPSRKIHPTEKPVEMLAEVLDTVLFPNSRILVPFLGSGATLRAAYSQGHTGLGFDLSATYRMKFLRRVKEDALLAAGIARAEPPTEETDNAST